MKYPSTLDLLFCMLNGKGGGFTLQQLFPLYDHYIFLIYFYRMLYKKQKKKIKESPQW